MKYVFWCSAAVILYTYIGYPFLIWARSKVAPRPWKRADITPAVSIIVAVHNGLELIRAQIPRLLAIDYPPGLTEIIVVSDGSTDGTAEFLRSFHHHRVRTIVLEEQGGKAVALNAGIRSAQNEILVFVDARPVLAPNAVRELVKNFADPSVGCAAGELSLATMKADASVAAVGDLYWRYEKWIRFCESQCDRVVGVSGCLYAVRRSLATLLPPGTILDDMYEPLSVMRQRSRVVVDEQAHVFDSCAKSGQGEFERKARTLAGNIQLVQLAPWVLGPENRARFQLLSHKLLRLIAPYLLAAVLVSSAAIHTRVFMVVFLLQLALYITGLLGMSEMSGRLRVVAGPAGAFCLLNIAAIVAAYRFLFADGPLWKMWTRSSREAGNTSVTIGKSAS